MDTVSYNRYSRYLHWLIAGLIIFTIILGWRNEDHDTLRLSRINLHKSIGILILLLSFVRIGLRLVYKAPPEPPMPNWQLWTAKALHFGFYLVMIGMPLTGWLMVSTSVRPIPFFGLEWPHFPGVPIEMQHEGPVHEFFEFFHKTIAKVLIYGMIPLHVLAALKHQFVDKDDVMQHMVPGLKPKPVLNWRWLLPVGVAVAAIGLGYGIYRGTTQARPSEDQAPGVSNATASEVNASASESAATTESASSVASSGTTITTWAVDKANTKINFSTDFEGESVTGGFEAYAAQIAFDPDHLDTSHVRVTIDLSSVASGDNDRDSSLKSDSFFNIAVFPKAVFEASSFTKKDATHFVAHGKLTLHGVTKAQELPFTLTIKDKIASMTAVTSLDRTVFGIGSGDFASTDTVPAKVGINIALRARASQ